MLYNNVSFRVLGKYELQCDEKKAVDVLGESCAMEIKKLVSSAGDFCYFLLLPKALTKPFPSHGFTPEQMKSMFGPDSVLDEPDEVDKHLEREEEMPQCYWERKIKDMESDLKDAKLWLKSQRALVAKAVFQKAELKAKLNYAKEMETYAGVKDDLIRAAWTHTKKLEALRIMKDLYSIVRDDTKTIDTRVAEFQEMLKQEWMTAFTQPTEKGPQAACQKRRIDVPKGKMTGIGVKTNAL